MTTILHRLASWAESEPASIAQSFKKNGEWTSLTSREFSDRVYWLALFFQERGMTSQDIGALLSYNCPEWVHADLGVLLLGAKTAGIYPNSTSKDILYVLKHTDSKFLFVQNKEYFQKITAAEGSQEVLDQMSLILVFDGDTSISPKAVSYETAVAEGKKLAAAKKVKKINDFLKNLNPTAGAFMIYTSGTTGNPKGAILSHDNLVFTIDNGTEYWEMSDSFGGTLFSFLPLCHVAETIQNIGVGISLRSNVNFCTSFESVTKELPEIQPTILLCVPRLWEKMVEGVMSKVEKTVGFKKTLALWALSVGSKVGPARLFGGKISILDRIQWELADRLVLAKIRQGLGLQRAQVLVSGAAALPSHISIWFRSLGLEIIEAFGQTESTGIICMTQRGVDSAGTVGKPVPGLEFKIAKDGEILTRGRHVFNGYFKDDVATAQVLEGGWLHTGDLAEINERGLVRIKGRKKEILKTSGGKMIAPVPIEEMLKSSPIISQVCMVGDGRKYLAALITLTESKLDEVRQSDTSLSQAVITSPKIVQEVKVYVDQLNSSLASYEQIKKFAVLSKEFSIDLGEMTPTLKMKRSVIEGRYREVIDQFYVSA